MAKTVRPLGRMLNDAGEVMGGYSPTIGAVIVLNVDGSNDFTHGRLKPAYVWRGKAWQKVS